MADRSIDHGSTPGPDPRPETAHRRKPEPCVRLVPVFSGLSSAQQAEVARFARPITVGAGQRVVRAGSSAPRLFVIHAGRVKVTRTSEAGHETVLRVLGPGEVVGETSFLTGVPAENDVTAVEPGRLCRFDHRDLAALLGRFPDIGVGMLRALATRLSSTEQLLAALTSSDVGARIAGYLLDLPATRSASGTATVHLPVTKKDVARHLGTSPETLSRRLAEFERAGLIRVLGGRNIAIADPAGLAERARS